MNQHPLNGMLPKISDSLSCSTLNLSTYIDRYNGYTKLQRLLFIAEKCTNLQVEAYNQLLVELKKGCNTALYMKIYYLVGAALGHGADLDRDWVESTEKRETMKLERLESELMTAKTTIVKESIRLSYNDIGDLHYERGNLSEAMKSYLRTRDYCTVPKHNAEMCVRVASVSMDLMQYGNVLFYVTKGGDPVVADAVVNAKLKAASALVMLIEGQYKGAARKFLEVGIEIGGSFSSIIAAEDIAMYGTLCALASLERPEIRSTLLENSRFKSFLELTPDVRLLVDNFFTGKYGDCLSYLESIKSELLLDLHLSKHVVPLISQITERIIIQYFFPYSSVDMNRMSSQLNLPFIALEKSLSSLISKDIISARIDSQSKTLIRKQSDVRSVTMDKVLKLSETHVRDLKRGMLRLSVMKDGLQVTNKDDKIARDAHPTSSNRSSSNNGGGGGGGGYSSSLNNNRQNNSIGSSSANSSHMGSVSMVDNEDRMQMETSEVSNFNSRGDNRSRVGGSGYSDFNADGDDDNEGAY
jgi:COP9 signalosome complex subunit 1